MKQNTFMQNMGPTLPTLNSYSQKYLFVVEEYGATCIYTRAN